MSQIRRIKSMKIINKEVAVAASPLKKIMLADKKEVTIIFEPMTLLLIVVLVIVLFLSLSYKSHTIKI